MAYTAPRPLTTSLAGPAYIASADFDMAEPVHVSPSALPPIAAAVGAQWGTGARANATLRGKHQNARKLDYAPSVGFDLPQVIEHRYHGHYKLSGALNLVDSVVWSPVSPQESRLSSPHKQAPKKDIRNQPIAWDDSIDPVELAIAGRFIVDTPHKDNEQRAGYFEVDRYGAIIRPQIAVGYVASTNFDLLEVAWVASPGAIIFDSGIDRLEHASQPKDQTRRFEYSRAPTRTVQSAIPWGPGGHRDTSLDFRYPVEPDPVTDPPDEPAIKGSYIVANLINAVRVSDNLPLNIQNIAITLDVDSWSWELSAEVIGKSNLDPIKPTSGGLVDIQITLNGHAFVFMVESYSGSQKHADERYRIKGVSRTQLLASPYAPTSTGFYASTINANQIIDDELLNTGFSITWDTTPTWSIPGGAYGYRDQSPIQVAKAIADAAGAVLVPSRTADSLTLQPRFKVSPWSLPTAAIENIDRIIPASMVTQLAQRWSPGTLYDSSYVSGTTAGVSVLATRDGYGGTDPAPNVFDDLITDVDVGTERARQQLASGAKSYYDLTLPVPESAVAPGLIGPGMIVEYIEPDASRWRGYVLGVAIRGSKTGADRIDQVLSVVRFHDYGEVP